MNRKYFKLFIGLVVFPMTLLLLANNAFANTNPHGDNILRENNNPSTSPEINLSADEMMDFNIAIDDISVDPNQEFCVGVSVSNFIDLLGLGFTLTFDTLAIEFVDVRNLNLSGLSSSSISTPGQGANPNNQLTLAWFDNQIAGVTVPDGTVIFELCFRAIGEGSSSSITFSKEEAVDINENVLNFVSDPGAITVSGDSGGTNPDPVTLAAGSSTIQQGDQVCVPVTATNFTAITNMQFNAGFNGGVLDFDGVQNVNLPGFSVANITETSGNLAINWSSAQAAGNSLANGTVLFELCFTGSAAGTSAIDLSSGSFTNADSDNPAATLQDGSIVVQGTTGPTPFLIDITDANVSLNDNFCVGVTVDGFTDLTGLEVVITYDPTKLQFDNVGNFNLKDLSNGSFGLPGSGTNPAGQLKLSWNDAAATGVTLNNGTRIFDICFTAIRNNTSTNLGFQAGGAEVINKDDELVTFNGGAGTVVIGDPNSTSYTEFAIEMDDQTVQAGDTFCIPVEVYNFNNMGGLEFVITFDPADFEYVRVDNFNLSDLNDATIREPGEGGNPAGEIKVSWVDLSGTGIDLTDGTSIFDLCLRAIGTGTSTVQVDETQAIEIINGNDELIDYELESAQINIEGILPTTDLVFAIGDASTTPGTEVCVDVSVTNFTDITGAEFSIEFDNTVLSYNEVKNLNLKDLNLSMFGEPGVGTNPDNQLKLAWTDAQVAGVTVPDGTVIFQVCFDPLINEGTTIVEVDDRVVEAINSSDELVETMLVPGTITISDVPPLTLAGPAAITQVTCFGEATGSINITPQGGSGSYTFLWNYQNRTTEDLASVPAGNYTVTITDAVNGQSINRSFTVTQPASAVSVFGSTVTPVNCLGGSDGAIQLNASGGTGTLTYSWSGGLPNTANPSGLSAGTYTVTITDANGCSVTSQPIVVGQPTAAVSATATVTDATCNESNGSITVNVSGGTGPYTLDWAGTIPDNQTTVNNVGAGTYNVTITDANGCTFSDAYTVTESDAIEITNFGLTYISNGTGGGIVLNVTGGSGTYTYAWTGPGGFSANTKDLTNLSATGEYCVTIRDNAGCEITQCAMMLEQLGFAGITISETCFGANTGGVQLNINGGASPYSFNWSTGATTQNLTNLAAGNYEVTVTDSQGASLSGSFEVQENPEISLSETITPVTGTTSNTNGSISLAVSGGSPGFTVSWSNGRTGTTINNLGTGTYTATVTDSEGCTQTGTFEVGFVSEVLAYSLESTNIECNGQSTGTLTLSIRGGVAPYAVRFSDEVNMSANNGMVTRTGLPAGDISFTITDASGATITGGERITQPDPIVAADITIKHDTDEPGCTGSIALNLSGGTPGYSVLWNSPNSGAQIINLCEGTFIPTVVDANNCQVTLEGIEITAFGLSASSINTDCPDDINGGLDLQVAGGSTPYTFEWKDNAGAVVSTSEDLSGVGPGTYTVKVSETTGNTLTRTYTVETNSMLSLDLDILSDYNGFDVSCENGADGMVRATARNGAGNSYMYEWILDNEMVSTNALLTNAAPGTYTLIATDALGCSVTSQVQLQAPSALSVNASVTDESCPGDTDGVIVATASGGNGTGGYSYAWNNQASGQRIDDLQEGDYTVTVTDANNCTTFETFTVGGAQPISVTLEAEPATDGCNGSVTATVTGGTAPFLFNWNSGATNAGAQLNNLCPGDYILMVTDANGCEAPQALTSEVLDRRYPCNEVREVITPDGDGLNEEFMINCIEELNNNQLRIFNRWGEMVFEATNYSNNWKGVSADGEQLPDGPYYWVLEYTDFEGNFVQQKGSLTLMRE